MVRAISEEQIEEAIDVLRRPAVDDVDVERHHRRAHENSGQPSDDDELDLRFQQIDEGTLSGVIDRHSPWPPASSR